MTFNKHEGSKKGALSVNGELCSVTHWYDYWQSIKTWKWMSLKPTQAVMLNVVTGDVSE